MQESNRTRASLVRHLVNLGANRQAQYDRSTQPVSSRSISRHDYWWPSGDQDLYDLPTHQALKRRLTRSSHALIHREVETNCTNIRIVLYDPASDW